jgi:hypothetical protein
MAITKVKNYTASPYYDDYNEEKNYHRVLFRPGYAVQARELTQLQTSLQAQIDRFGQHSFSDGARVVSGKPSLDIEYAYIKIEDEFYSTVATGTGAAYDTSTYITDFLEKTIIGTDNTGAFQVEAKVLAVLAAGSGPAHESNGSDPITLYIKYTKSGGSSAANRTVQTFGAGEVFKTTTGSVRVGKVQGEASASTTEFVGTVAETNSTLSNGTQTGLSAAIHMEEGVYFISGCFSYVPAQTLILKKYTNTPSFIIGLNVAENIISSEEDPLLVDNAQGVPNSTAPGANRYQIVTTLVAEPISLSARTKANYIFLLEVVNGIANFASADDSANTELNEKLARRTFEESGSYAVQPFPIAITDYYNDNTNFGFKTSAQIIAAESGVSNDAQALVFGKNRLNIELEKSVAYVKGKRIETTPQHHIIYDKARALTDVAVANAAVSTLPLGGYIKLTASGMKGMPDISTMHTIDLKNSSAATIGTARCRGLEKVGSIYYLYIFDVVMTGAFSAVTNVSQTNAGQQTFVANLSVNGTRFEAGRSSSIYRLPASTIKTLKTVAADGTVSNAVDTDYIVRAYMTSTVDASGNIDVTCPSGGVLANNDDIYVSVDNNDLRKATGVAASGGGGVGASTFRLTTAELESLSISNTEKVQVIASIRRVNNNGGTRKNKGLTSDHSLTLTANGSGSYGLGKNDIIKITSITDSTGAAVKDKFTLDNGQRENFYEEGNIILKGGQSVPNGNLVVVFDFYTHSAGDYFCVDSYYDAASGNAANTTKYEIIPTFNSSVNGLVDLRDCLDFRPSKATTGATAGFELSSGANAFPAFAPSPGTIVTNDITFYLARTDKIFLTEEGEFKYVKGTSAIFPEPPEDIANSMTLYTISANPYVFTPNDIKAVPVDNKRYTMRDIGALDKRIKNLEYYTSLSLLESSASQIDFIANDGSGTSRFKNGFIVDSFSGASIGNSSHPDWSVATDKANGILRPVFDQRSINLVRTTGDATGSVSSAGQANGVDAKATQATKGGIVTMSHTVVPHITQPYSTYAEYINPYNVFVWEGSCKLSPESDEWKEVDVRPDIPINDNSIYDQFVAMAEETGILGTVWNEWETNWTGRDVNTSTSLSRQRRGGGEGGQEGGGWGGRIAEIKTTTTATTLTGTQSRSGLSTSIASDTITKEIGNYVVETNFIPFMRSRKISFDAELLKPETRMFAFFGGVDITAYCKQSAYSSGSSHVDADFSEFSEQTSVNTFEGVTTFVNSSTFAVEGGTLITDPSGRCVGQFIIPRNDILKFRTGIKEFKITDSSVNADTADTHASATFHAQGLLEVHQRTVVSTKVPRLVTREISQTGGRVEKTTSTTKNEFVRWIDPLAQTFVVDGKTNTTYTDGSPPPETGIFAKSIQIYFATKDAAIPVQVSIRSVENGIPTQNIVPGSDVTIYPTSITTSATAATATTIPFDYPVYLERDTEYCVVLIANSDVYKVYVSEVGGFDLTDQTFRVIKQPYNGVFFTSANASTWTPEQTKDLKFVLNRCSFTNDKEEIILNNDVVPLHKLGITPLEYLSNSTNTEIRVHHRSHGMYGAGTSKVTLAGFAAENGLSAANLNATHTIKTDSKALDSYIITISGVACTTTGIVGGTKAGTVPLTATENQPYNVLKPSIENLQVPGTNLKLYLTSKTGASVDGTLTAFSNVPEQEILMNKNFITDVPHTIPSATIESDLSTGKGIITRIEMDNGGNERISPVIDLNRASVICVENRINDPISNSSNYTNVKQGTAVAETVANGTSSKAKYITKTVELENEADLIDVYLNVNRPNSSNIDVYYKVAASGDDTNFDTLPWVLDAPEVAIPVNDSGRYSEAHYAIDPPIGKFSRFAIKIVLRSTNSSNVPTCSDLRAIATT